MAVITNAVGVLLLQYSSRQSVYTAAAADIRFWPSLFWGSEIRFVIPGATMYVPGTVTGRRRNLTEAGRTGGGGRVRGRSRTYIVMYNSSSGTNSRLLGAIDSCFQRRGEELQSTARYTAAMTPGIRFNATW